MESKRASKPVFDQVGPTWRRLPGEIVRPPLMSAATGRRKEPRYEGASSLLWMQWWEGDEYLGRAARLINVSRGGAMIVAAVLLQPRQEVRVFLEEVEDSVGVNGIVLGSVEGKQGLHQMRLMFKSPCPESFIEAAAHSFEMWMASGQTRVVS